MKYMKTLVTMVLLIALDQLTKLWAVQVLKGKEAISVVKGVFEFRYLENRGIAFGLFQNKYMFFIIFTSIILVILVYIYRRIPQGKRMLPIRICVVLLASGAVGNLIDRIINNYVIDFLYVRLINFPIFNVADCYVTVSMVALLLLVIFYYKDEELIFSEKQDR